MPDFGDVPEPTSGGAGAAAGATIGGAIGAIGKNMGEAQKQSSALLDSAKGGGFRVGENAGKDLQDAITEALGDLDEIIIEADQLTVEPKLGTGPYAQQVAQHVRQSGDGPQGALPMLQQLRTVLQQSEEALKIAMQNYREAEQQQKQTFRQ